MAALGADEEANALANLKAIADAGIEIGAGTDAGNPFAPHGPGLLYELSLYVDAGLTPAQALRAATLSSARILGIDDRFGSIEPGKVADLVIVPCDPSVSIANLWDVKTVLKGGAAVDRAAAAARIAAFATPAVTRVGGVELPAELAGFDAGRVDSAWGGTWTAWSDQVARGKSTAVIEAAADGDAHVLRLKGAVAEGFQWGAWAGATLALDARNKLLADASRYAACACGSRARSGPT